MSNLEINSKLRSALMTVCTLIFCSLRGAVVLAWTKMTGSRVRTPQHPISKHKTAAYDAEDPTTDHPFLIDAIDSMKELYCSKYDQIQMSNKCLSIEHEIHTILNSNKMMQERILLLEDMLYQQKMDHDNLKMAIKDQLGFRDSLNDRALTALREINGQMEEEIETLKDSETSTYSVMQKLADKLVCLEKNMVATPPPADRKVIYRLENKIEKLQSMLFEGKKLFNRSNEKMKRKIVSLKSEIAELKCNRSNIDVLRNDLKKQRAEDIKNFESRLENDLGRLIKQLLTPPAPITPPAPSATTIPSALTMPPSTPSLTSPPALLVPPLPLAPLASSSPLAPSAPSPPSLPSPPPTSATTIPSALAMPPSIPSPPSPKSLPALLVPPSPLAPLAPSSPLAPSVPLMPRLPISPVPSEPLMPTPLISPAPSTSQAISTPSVIPARSATSVSPYRGPHISSSSGSVLRPLSHFVPSTAPVNLLQKPLKAPRERESKMESQPLLDLELIRNSLRKSGEKPKKVFRLPTHSPKTDG